MLLKKKMRLNISIVLMLTVMILFSMDLYASQNDIVYSAGHFYYHSYPGYVSICGYIGDETDISIPSSISGKPVSVIESNAFDGCDSIKTIEVPDTVMKVAEDSFTGAGSLERIVSHTVDVTINAGEGVSVEYTSQTGDGSYTGVSSGDTETYPSDKADTGSDNKNDGSSVLDDQGQKTADVKPKEKNTVKDSDSKQTDIGEGSYVEPDGDISGTTDSDISEYKDVSKTIDTDETEEKKDAMLTAENSGEDSIADTATVGSDIQNESATVSFVTVLVFALCLAAVIGVSVYFVLKKKK